ncbi:hypothetical protein H5410_021170 [Solanum commersonii]|uniref:Uncharacterized protein n=1 Tax=Solanum commersonii TaxID=4109 RepID=A0A9J5ZAJ8_SOLCO|nr:hypothetical protein H5410_021170 [Solanum commersonii]
MFKSFITKVDEKFENQSASIRNLEKQVGQIANQISERTPGTLPSDTVRNPKDLKVVTLRSGKMLSENCQSPKEKSRESQVETKESHEIKKGSFAHLRKFHSERVTSEPQQTRSLPRCATARNQAQTHDQRAGLRRSRAVSPLDHVGHSFNRVISTRASHQEHFSHSHSFIKNSRILNLMENSQKRKKLGVVPSKRGTSSTQKGSNSSKEKESPPLKSYDATKFVSWEAQQRFKVKSFKKVIVEKGVEQAEDEYRTIYMKEPYKWDMFIEVICTFGQPVHWLKENHKFHSKSLNIEAKCWFHITTSRIFPSTNTTELCRLSTVKFKKSDVTLMVGLKFRVDRMTIEKAIRQPASTEEVGNDDVDDVEELLNHVVPPTQST